MPPAHLRSPLNMDGRRGRDQCHLHAPGTPRAIMEADQQMDEEFLEDEQIDSGSWPELGV